MNLTHTISADRRTLTIHADASARAELRDMPESAKEASETGNAGALTLHSDAAMFDAFERTLCNGDLCWIRPEECGDLTDGPILGIYADDSTLTQPIVAERWGFMDYAVRSPLQDLRDTGAAVFSAP